MAEQTKFVYNADGVSFVIYKSVKPSKSGPKTYWLLEDESTGKRRTLNNVSREAAERRADQIRAASIKGKAHQLLLTHGQWQEVCVALEALSRAKSIESVGSVVRLWLECTMMLGDRATPLDAVKFYLAHYKGNGPQPKPIRFDEAAQRYHAFKVADGKSASHCGNIQSRLNRLAETLPAGVLLDDLTAGQLEQAVVSLGLRPKTRNEYKITLGNLYTWGDAALKRKTAKGQLRAMGTWLNADIEALPKPLRAKFRRVLKVIAWTTFAGSVPNRRRHY